MNDERTTPAVLTLWIGVLLAAIGQTGCRSAASPTGERPLEKVAQTAGTAEGTPKPTIAARDEPSDRSRWSNWLDRLYPSARIPLPLSKSAPDGERAVEPATTLSEVNP